MAPRSPRFARLLIGHFSLRAQLPSLATGFLGALPCNNAKVAEFSVVDIAGPAWDPAAPSYYGSTPTRIRLEAAFSNHISALSRVPPGLSYSSVSSNFAWQQMSAEQWFGSVAHACRAPANWPQPHCTTGFMTIWRACSVLWGL